MDRFNRVMVVVSLPGLIALCGCQDLVPHDTQSLLFRDVERSEVLGLVAGFGTTFAAMPDLIAMLRRRSSAGMNPRMASIMGAFQILWVYYGFVDCFATGGGMECGRGVGQFRKRRRLPLFCP